VKRTLAKVAVGNLILWSLALAVGCNCVCRSKPGSVGSAPSRTMGDPDKRPGALWHFVVSGDSRNCGDVIAPVIAKGAKIDGAAFYWHLGDLRAIYNFDEDMLQIAKIKDKPLNISAYELDAWEDFKRNQIGPFSNIPMPYYLGIGNHETISPKNRCEFARTFQTWLDQDNLQEGKNNSGPASQIPSAAAKGTNAAEQSPTDTAQKCVKGCAACAQLEAKTYYHWTKSGVDFIYLDNATDDQFDQRQTDWLEGVLKNEDQSIKTIVVGMHKALPWSVSCDHSMNADENGNENPTGIKAGEQVYRDLLKMEGKGKKVYVLASHSHYFMSDIYNTRRWRSEGVLPGWIIGTAGAQRYPLPPGADLTKSKTYVYGYLLGAVYPDGTIDFAFTELKENEIPDGVKNTYTDHWISEACFDRNRKPGPVTEPAYCKDTSALQ